MPERSKDPKEKEFPLKSILSDERIRTFLRETESKPDHPVAVFDCDGTMVKGDVGEAMLYHQLEQFHFRMSPGELWTDYPGRARLHELYTTLRAVPAGERQRHPAFAEFADAILGWYFGQIEEGKVAKACTDIVRLFVGYTVEEVRQIARASFADELQAPMGERLLGKRTLPRGIRYIRETLELLRVLRADRFEIWVVSGSSKWSVEPVFEPLGIPRQNIIGIELLDNGGKLTRNEVLPVPIRKDKVAAFQKRTDRVPVLVASDSRNDIPLLLYSSMMKVRINSRGRSTDEFFADIGGGPDATWVNVENPTIIENGELTAMNEAMNNA